MRPLDDVTVIEVDSWMAAPSACAILADLGATVLKVEPIGGDPMRNQSRTPKIDDGPRKTYDYHFDVANRGKQSIMVDLGSEQGTALLHKLCADADVFVCNLLTRRQERFGLDPDTLHQVNPTLVHATITGFGTTGPEAWRPGYDVTAFFARSGLYYGMREGPEGVPPMARTAQGDYTTGLALFGAVVAALRLAERSGEGQVVETSLYETAVWTLATDYSVTAQDRAPFRPRQRDQQIIATANRFMCGDGLWIVTNMPLESSWPGFAEALGHPEWVEQERFIDMRNRFRNMPELIALMDEAFATKTRAEWGAHFDEHNIVWGPVMGFDEVVNDPQAEAIGLFPRISNDEIGEYATVSNPINFRSAEAEPTTGAPRRGEHTRDVLAAAGFDADEVSQLIKDGVVG